MELTINRLATAEPDALHCHYPEQINPQPVHLELDTRDGTLRCDYNPDPGPPHSIPASVYHRIALRWTIPCLTTEAANQLMGKIASLARRVLAGSDVTWDGSNHVGTLDDDAVLAYDDIEHEIEKIVGDLPQVSEVDVNDWFAGVDDEDLGVTAAMTDDDLQRRAGELQDEARQVADSNDHVVLRGVEGYLRRIREEARDAARDELEAVAEKLENVRARRDELIRTTGEWGDSDRSTAILAALSHTHIANIRA